MSEPRFETSIATDFELGSMKAAGRVENASSGGLFIRTATIPRPGEKLWLSFEGPGGEVVEAIGTVYWTTLDRGRPTPGPCGAQGFGVRLVASSGDYRRLITRLSRAYGRLKTGSRPVS